MNELLRLALLWVSFTTHACVLASTNQVPLSQKQEHVVGPRPLYQDIRRVAVIGAGPAGLQAAATFIAGGFQVRLFERTTNPGGVWHYNTRLPITSSFPNKPVEIAGYTPDIPSELPKSHLYIDGEDDLSNDERLREHWNPSPVWQNLRANSAPGFTSLPSVNYPDDAEWLIPNRLIQRHVRQYAASVGLNPNDDEHSTVLSYSTRVEKLRKAEGSAHWTLSLRKLEQDPHNHTKVHAHWWEEDFDAVFVAAGEIDSSYTPDIPGLHDWAQRFPGSIYHSREYRVPEKLRGKHVLIIGAGVSASEIARDLQGVARLSISIPHPGQYKSIFQERSVLRLPANITHLPRIQNFSSLRSYNKPSSIGDLSLLLVNGTWVDGFDEIIFATGYRRSHPFLVDYHNSSIVGNDDPETARAPIITDGTHLRSIHWTGNYIPDPTLAFAFGRAWTIGRYQALGLAKIWSGKARLPTEEQMWQEHPHAKGVSSMLGALGGLSEEAFNRLWVAWLNNASLEFGGRFVEPWPVKYREQFVYFAHMAWKAGYVSSENFTRWDDTPRKHWPFLNSSDITATMNNAIFQQEEEILQLDVEGEPDLDGTVLVRGPWFNDR